MVWIYIGAGEGNGVEVGDENDVEKKWCGFVLVLNKMVWIYIGVGEENGVDLYWC
ncbi:hypothetical protein Glove_309g119 [Diversispora epigaea]|uniref:Uncharacterized protein n=1 Tax=Diversispora epigaea TaxID=1348612 RepID=A0A397HZQ7_9GLOM|nr:hypothetical protein Glove_309g119 [Diversispora epigaea]